jgi:hypothetical protein
MAAVLKSVLGSLLGLALLAWPGLAPQPARAQGDSGSVYSTAPKGPGTRGPLDWLIGRRVQPDPVQAVPRNEARPRSYQPRRRGTPAVPPGAPAPSATPGDPAQPGLPGADPAAPSVDVAPAPSLPPASVVVAGDSLSVFLGQGLQEIYQDRPHVTFLKRQREASGLVRDDYYDWPKNLHEMIAGTGPLNAVVVLVGSNDRQQLRDETGVQEPLSPRWRELYAKRVDDLVAVVKERALPLIWVGLPVMRSEKYSADLIVLNDIYKSRAQAAGIVFIDLWEAFAAEDGSYVASGPDVDGEIVRLRTADGVHFTRAGARKLAFFVDRELQKILNSAPRAPQQPREAVPSGLPPPPQVQVVPGFPAVQPQSPVSIDTILGVPVPEAAVAPTLVPRPAQGAVMPLTAAPVTTGAQLIAPPSPAPGSEAAQVFVQGRPQSAKPGRLDDFRLER